MGAHMLVGQDNRVPTFGGARCGNVEIFVLTKTNRKSANEFIACCSLTLPLPLSECLFASVFNNLISFCVLE